MRLSSGSQVMYNKSDILCLVLANFLTWSGQQDMDPTTHAASFQPVMMNRLLVVLSCHVNNVIVDYYKTCQTDGWLHRNHIILDVRRFGVWKLLFIGFFGAVMLASSVSSVIEQEQQKTENADHDTMIWYEQPNCKSKCWQCTFLQIPDTVCCNFTFLWVQHSSLSCDNCTYALVRFGHQNHLVRVQKRPCFCLKYLFWMAETRLEMSRGPFKHIMFKLSLEQWSLAWRKSWFHHPLDLQIWKWTGFVKH